MTADRADAIARTVAATLAAPATGGGASTVRAHPGLPLEPHDLLTAWTWEPTVLLGLLLVSWLYARGVCALWRRAGRGRGIAGWRVGAFAGGMLALVAALVSPLDALGTALFVAHMGQHTLLVLAAAPLLVLGSPHLALLWAIRPRARRRLGRWYLTQPTLRAGWHGLTHPATVWVLHAGALWLWHLPGPYQWALTSGIVHGAEHASFLGTALLFWWAVPGVGPHPRLNPVAGILYLFTFTLQGGILGALMTFSGSPWYPVYAATAPAWGLTPLDDQQLAGLMMWIPAGLVYVVAALVPMAIWLDKGSAPPVEQEPPAQVAGERPA